MGMEQTYDLRVTEPGERISVHIESSTGRRTGAATVFDATASLPSTPPCRSRGAR